MFFISFISNAQIYVTQRVHYINNYLYELDLISSGYASSFFSYTANIKNKPNKERLRYIVQNLRIIFSSISAKILGYFFPIYKFI